jgi:hypothetical protein
MRPGFVNARLSVGGGQWPGMPADRDVTAFDERASRYDQGWLGRLHQDIVKRTIEVALLSQPHPRRILDVG